MAQAHTPAATETPAPAPPPSRPQPNVSGAVMRRKLTAGEVYGKLPAMEKGAPERWHGDWYCFVTGKRQETSPLGDYYRWLGQFRHVDLHTGEMLESSTAIVPMIASDLIESAVMGGDNIGGEARNILVAFRLGTTFDMNKAGYKYILKLIKPPSREGVLDLFIKDAYQSAPMVEHQPAVAEAAE